MLSPNMADTSKGQFLHGSDLTEAICGVLSGDRRDVAVAFWGADPLKRLGIDDPAEMRVGCDLYSGACNPAAIKDLLQGGARVYNVPGLHAKVYLGATAMVVCSANVSANGLGEEGVEILDGLEAGIRSDVKADLERASDWFAKLLMGRAPVGPEALPELKRLWSMRRHGRPKRLSGTLLQAMIRHDPILQDRAFKMVVYTVCEPTPEVKEAYWLYDPTPINEGAPYPYFFDARRWKVRSGDLILSFESDGKLLSCEGVWRVRDVLHRGQLVPLVLEKEPLGLKLDGYDRRALTKQVRALIKQGLINVHMAPITIEAFAHMLRPAVPDSSA